MKEAFVADASVAIGWVHPAQATTHTEAMLDAIGQGSRLEVPALWPLEVANALVVLQRRRKLTEAERQAGLGWLRNLPLHVDSEMPALAFSRLSELASEHYRRLSSGRTSQRERRSTAARGLEPDYLTRRGMLRSCRR